MLLNKHNLNVHTFCATEESRYTLRAILVTKDETVATDGHRLVRVTTPKVSESLFPSIPDFKAEEIDKPVLLHADTAKEISASIPKGKQALPVLATAKIGQVEGQCKSVTTDLDLNHLIEGRKVEGQFPSWQAVIPTGKPTAEVCISAKYLADISKFAGAISDSGFMRIQIFGPDKGVRIDAEDALNGQGMTAVVMPARVSSTFENCFKANGKPAAKSA